MRCALCAAALMLAFMMIVPTASAQFHQQGAKLVGADAAGAANQGFSVAVSGDGNTAVVGGVNDNSSAGAAWVYTRSGGAWSQQGTKLVGTGAALLGYSQVGAPRDETARLIEWTAGRRVLSVAVPSGLELESGQLFEPHVVAEATLTLALPQATFTWPTSRFRRPSTKASVSPMTLHLAVARSCAWHSRKRLPDDVGSSRLRAMSRIVKTNHGLSLS